MNDRKDKIKKNWPKLKSKFNNHFEDLILGLFSSLETPLFNKEGIELKTIQAFAKNESVQYCAYEFIFEIRELWQGQFKISAPNLHARKKKSTCIDSNIREISNLSKGDGEMKTVENSSKTGGFDSPSNKSSGTDNIENKMWDNSKVKEDIDQASKDSSDTKKPEEFELNLRKTEKDLDANCDQTCLSENQVLNDGGLSRALTLKKDDPEPFTSRDNPHKSGSTINDQRRVSVQKPFVPIEPRPSFHLPNCKVGILYSAKIEGTDKSGRNIRVVDVKFPDDLGLEFDPETSLVTGEPKKDGDFVLNLQWSFVNESGKWSGTCNLTSNPDPKSLWKVIEPEAGLPYPKPHLDQKLIIGANFKMAAASRRGRSHEHGGSFRDDDFFISDHPDSGWGVLIVADGAGSAKNSREGSRIAVETSGKHLMENLTGEFGSKIADILAQWDADATAKSRIATEFHYFFHKMATLVIQAIEQEAKTKEAPVKEYSTTLLAAAIKKDGLNTFMASFWMGDGAIAAYGPQGRVKLMGTPDGGEFAGQTRFLDRSAVTDQGFGKRVGVGRWQDITSVILMTDGVSDPFFETDQGLADPERWDGLWGQIKRLLDDSSPEQRLVEWLHFFKQGHHDDRTIALLW